MKKVLWISMMAPYDAVGHASGQTQNYYLKYVHSNSDLEITLLTTCKDFELSYLDLDRYGIKNKVYVRKWSGMLGFIRRGFAWLSKFNLLNQYAGLTPFDISHGIKTLLMDIFAESYRPNCIIVQWTEILFLLPEIRKYYPEIPVVAIEEDVSYLGQLRRMQHSNSFLKKLFYEQKYKRVRKLELSLLEKTNLVILNNQKDYMLVRHDGLKADVWVWSVYFQSGLERTPRRTGKDIVYYGAMSREENWKSAEWFILNVMPRIKDPDVRFLVIGSRPNRKLFRYSSEKVVIRGFVEDISSELLGAMCLVAPLVLGAGIKVKILEALSCGIPVLTNSIGIEGIPAVNRESYFHCETPQDYIYAIELLLENKIDIHTMESKAKEVIRTHFHYEDDAKQLIKNVNALIDLHEADCQGKDEL